MKVAAVLIMVAPLLAGCAPAMQGMHGGGTHTSGQPSVRLIQEVRTSTLVASLEVPPIRVHDEVLLTLMVTDATTGHPVTNLTVMFQLHQPPVESFTAPAVHDPVSGKYVLAHTFSVPGSVNVAATVGPMDDNPLTVHAIQEVLQSSDGRRHARRSSITYLGGLVMLTMMMLKFVWL